MSCSHAAAYSRSVSAPRTGARPRARAATPWMCAQRQGRGSPAGVPGRAVRPMMPACSDAQARQPRRDVHGPGGPSEDVLLSVTSRHLACWPRRGGRTCTRDSAGFGGCRSLTRAALRSVPATGSRSCPPAWFLAPSPWRACQRKGGHRVRGISPGVGRRDLWSIHGRARALLAARTNLPSRRTDCLATQTCDGDGRVSARVRSPPLRADTRESPLRVQLKKLTGNGTTHGDPAARLP